MIGTASYSIPAPAAGPQLRKTKYRTGDIIDVVQDIVNRYASETAVFSGKFQPTRGGLKKLFNWVDTNFVYREDPPDSQLVQTPAWLNRHKIGDCKSFTVFISSVLQNMGIDHLIRYTAYGTREFRHVYPVAILDGVEIPLDVVWKKQRGGHFGGEKKYTRKKDFKVKGLYQLGSIDGHMTEHRANAIIGQLETTIAELDRHSSTLPSVDPNDDVTTWTKGDAERAIIAERFRIMSNITKHGGKRGTYADAALALEQGSIAGIGSLKGNPFGKQVEKILQRTVVMTEPAFPPFEISVPTPPEVQNPRIEGLFKKIGKFFKKVGKAIGRLFKKFVNWIFKGAGKAMGPFFIFQFLNKRQIKSPEIKNRIKSQEKSFDFIRRVGKFDKNQLKGLMLNGILEKTGKSPRQIAKEGGVPQIGAVAALAGIVIKAIGFVVKVIEKVASIFKRRKSDAGVIDESTMSDPSLFAEEARLQKPSSGEGDTSGGFNPIILAPLALFALR